MNYIKKDWIFHKLGVAPINWSSWLQPIISLNHWGRILNVEQSCKRHCILSITKLKICIVISNHVFNWYSIQFHMHTSNISNIKAFNFLMNTSMWHSTSCVPSTTQQVNFLIKSEVDERLDVINIPKRMRPFKGINIT
jgi:hypothetical protein